MEPHKKKEKTSVGSVDDMEVVLVGMLKEAWVATVYDPGFSTIQESSLYNSFVDADLFVFLQVVLGTFV